MSNEIAIGNSTIRETEKAILVRVCTLRGIETDVWFPKSQVRSEGHVLWVPEWLLKAKGRDLGSLVVSLSPDVIDAMIAA